MCPIDFGVVCKFANGMYQRRIVSRKSVHDELGRTKRGVMRGIVLELNGLKEDLWAESIFCKECVFKAGFKMILL